MIHFKGQGSQNSTSEPFEKYIVTSAIFQVSLSGFLGEEMVCGWAFLPEQYQRMLQGIAFFHVNILLLYPVLLLTGMNTVNTCLVSNYIDTFLEACALNNSGFAGTLVVGKTYKIVFSDFFFPNEATGV